MGGWGKGQSQQALGEALGDMAFMLGTDDVGECERFEDGKQSSWPRACRRQAFADLSCVVLIAILGNVLEAYLVLLHRLICVSLTNSRSSQNSCLLAATKCRAEVLGLLSEAWAMAELTGVGPEVLCKTAWPLLAYKVVTQYKSHSVI